MEKLFSRALLAILRSVTILPQFITPLHSCLVLPPFCSLGAVYFCYYSSKRSGLSNRLSKHYMLQEYAETVPFGSKLLKQFSITQFHTHPIVPLPKGQCIIILNTDRHCFTPEYILLYFTS